MCGQKGKHNRYIFFDSFLYRNDVYLLICRSGTKVKTHHISTDYSDGSFTLLKRCYNFVWNNVISFIKSCFQIISSNFNSIVRLYRKFRFDVMIRLFSQWNNLLTWFVSSTAINSIECSSVLFEMKYLLLVMVFPWLSYESVWYYQFFAVALQTLCYSHSIDQKLEIHLYLLVFWRYNLWPHL